MYHYMPDTLSRSPRTATPQTNVDNSYPDDLLSDSPHAYAGPTQPVLYGLLLDHLTPADVHGQDDGWPLSVLLAGVVHRSTRIFLTGHSDARVFEAQQA